MQTDRTSSENDVYGRKIFKSLFIEPKDRIRFHGPYNRNVIEHVIITNPTNCLVAYKVKTNSPDRYRVKPVSGMLAPGDKQKITIMMYPLLKNTKPEKLNEIKFRCVFDNIEISKIKDRFEQQKNDLKKNLRMNSSKNSFKISNLLKRKESETVKSNFHLMALLNKLSPESTTTTTSTVTAYRMSSSSQLSDEDDILKKIIYPLMVATIVILILYIIVYGINSKFN
ncbi:hypothetical protein RDWZM_006448 [Blomia tropicalis]|uniref:MSP domain-containing protein n=1 Tax=Blomia tropicalis TaxID=40697 RepID=A0A9Q0M747_BLOTA|nr:hypothetical protein BLOT_008618 [Blomia tropicalis]KAJ6220636.1 hypothetical protein RDWZM_006448 [Blomia tropicalis]